MSSERGQQDHSSNSDFEPVKDSNQGAGMNSFADAASQSRDANDSSHGDPVATVHSTEQQLATPEWLHPSSILFDAASKFRSLIFPAVIALYSAASGGMWGLGIAGGLFSLSLCSTVFKYLTLRYSIKGSDLVVEEGFLFRRVRSVPIRRIQNIDLVQNVLHRIFGVAEVNIETASGTEPEAKLRVLTHQQIEQLRSALVAGRKNVSRQNVTESGSKATARAGDRQAATAGQADVATVDMDAKAESYIESPAAYTYLPGRPVGGTQAAAEHSSGLLGTASRPDRLISSISVKELVLAGLASNRGLMVIGIAIGLFFQFDFWEGEIRDQIKSTIGRASELANELRASGEELSRQTSTFSVVVMVMIAALLLFALLKAFSIAWYLLRFYGHRVELHGDDLRISCGLFTRVSATVPRRRIQFISVHRPLLFRCLKLASIRIETAGGGASEKENAASTVSRRWFIPVIAESKVTEVINLLRPGMNWENSTVTWHGVSTRTWKRLSRQAVVLGMLIGIAAAGFTWQWWGLLAGPAVLPLLIWFALRRSRAMQLGQVEWGVAYRSGVLTKKLSFAFFDRMQTLKIEQSWFDRRWKMATVSVDTASAGPADHTVSVQYLEADLAVELYQGLVRDAALHRPAWS